MTAAPPAGPPPTDPAARWVRWFSGLAAVGLLAAAGALAWGPVRSAAALERGRAALARHDPRAAAGIAAAAARRDPRNANLAPLSAVAARRAGEFGGDPDRLDAALARAARLGADPEAVRRERVLAEAAAGRLDGPGGALAELPGLLADDRGDLDRICAAYVNGLCLPHRFGPARRLLGEWEAADPGDAEAAYLGGLIELSQENLPAAEARFRAALAAAPGHVGAAVKLAEVMRVGAGRDAAGAAALLAPLAANSRDPAALGEYGLALTAAGRPAEAVAPLRAAAELDPRDLDRRRPLAEALLAAGDPAAALEAVGPLLDEWPGDVRGSLARARALRTFGGGRRRLRRGGGEQGRPRPDVRRRPGAARRRLPRPRRPVRTGADRAGARRPVRGAGVPHRGPAAGPPGRPGPRRRGEGARGGPPATRPSPRPPRRPVRGRPARRPVKITQPKPP